MPGGELFGGGGERVRVGVGAGRVGALSHLIDEDVDGALDLVVRVVHHPRAAVVEHERGRRVVAEPLTMIIMVTLARADGVLLRE